MGDRYELRKPEKGCILINNSVSNMGSLSFLLAGKDRGQKEKRASEDEMAGWHHRHNGHELGQTPGDGVGQGGLECCSPKKKSQARLGN